MIISFSTSYIGTRNVGMLGKIFGGDIAEVIGEVHPYQDQFIGFAMSEVE